MSYPEIFRGYAVFDKEHWGDFELHDYKPKDFEDRDIDIKIDYCGVCGSDLHTARSGWSPTNYPCVVGHEIVGRAVRVGPKVTTVKVGDLVGVGANAASCQDCKACTTSNEQYCPDLVETYNFFYPQGWKSFGGYANYSRVDERFVFPIPEGVPPEMAAPMLCGGLTMYSPLVRAGAGPGKRVGIVGIGGLGHFGILFAKALGAEVTAISHSSRKEEDARKMGASNFIIAGEPGWSEPYKRSLDIIISTNCSNNQPIEDYINLLDLQGTLVICGLPEDNLPSFNAFKLLAANAQIRGSNTGSKEEALKMLELAAKSNVKSWVEVRPMSTVNETFRDMDNSKARYRYVLKADFENTKL